VDDPRNEVYRLQVHDSVESTLAQATKPSSNRPAGPTAPPVHSEAATPAVAGRCAQLGAGPTSKSSSPRMPMSGSSVIFPCLSVPWQIASNGCPSNVAPRDVY
jgi:hypothetical protein